MKLVSTELSGVFLIEPAVHADQRGFFYEAWRRDAFAKQGLDADLVQDNHSRSAQGTLRGLHFQHPHGQVKLCRVTHGEVFDVVVDVREKSPTFGKWTAAMLSADNKRMIWIPAGFAHGFQVVSAHAEFLYKCSDYYSPDDERGVIWNDPALAIPWPLPDPIISAKDEKLPLLRDLAHRPPL